MMALPVMKMPAKPLRLRRPPGDAAPPGDDRAREEQEQIEIMLVQPRRGPARQRLRQLQLGRGAGSGAAEDHAVADRAAQTRRKRHPRRHPDRHGAGCCGATCATAASRSSGMPARPAPAPAPAGGATSAARWTATAASCSSSSTRSRTACTTSRRSCSAPGSPASPRLLRERDIDDAVGMVKQVVDWSGGTRIGETLKEFDLLGSACSGAARWCC